MASPRQAREDRLVRLAAVIAALLVAEGAFAAELPDPAPAFDASRTGREEPRFSVAMVDVASKAGAAREMVAQPGLHVGNKAVVVRWLDAANRPTGDHAVSVVIDRTPVARVVFWGDDGKGNFGYPFKELPDAHASLIYDEASRTVTYSKPYATPEGRRAVFSYKLEPMGESQVRLGWDLGLTEEQVAAEPAGFGLGVWISLPEYRAARVAFGDETYEPTDRESLLESNGVSRSAKGNLVYSCDVPTKGFSIQGENLVGALRESLNARPAMPDAYLLEYRLQPPRSEVNGSLVVDLGDVLLRSDQEPPPVGGVDFWAGDATHVAQSPVRNLMPNPSFEQGLRYWTWMDGGATYTPSASPRYSVTKHGLFGPSALLIRNVQTGSSGMMSFPIPLEDGEEYTLSFYARCQTDAKLIVSLASAAKAGRFRSPNGPWGDVENPDATFAITKAWQRYSRTFTADAAGIRVGIMAAATTLVDGVQLEKGRTPTAFVPPPIEGHLVTADVDNILEVGEPIEAKLHCVGEPGTQGVVAVTARNCFGEPVYRGRGRVSIGSAGEFIAPLPFSNDSFAEGVFVIRVDYEVPGSPAYFDYHRVAIRRALTNQHQTKNLCGTIGVYDRISRGEDQARWLMQWGFGSTSWGYNAEAPGERVRLEDKYRITNVANVLEVKDPVAKGFRDWQSVSPALAKQIEDAAYLQARRYDPQRDMVWAFGNEEESSYLVRNGLFTDHLRVQIATAKGVTRAIPGAIMLPTCGTTGYSRLRGYDAMEGYLSAAQAADWRYGGIAVHPYGSIDGGSLAMHDLDEETARLLNQMNRFGYGRETPVFYTEMFNIPEAYIPEWNADRSYDEYSAGKPTYDFGNREFVQAASAARAIIIMAKYWPQLQSANLWVAKPFMDMHLTPLLLCKAINTIGNLLGDVRHLGDIKPSPRIRGYVFERPDNSGVAAVWCIDREVENGLRRGPRIKISPSQELLFTDFMGCARDASRGIGGVIDIPLTAAPLFIQAPDAVGLLKELRELQHDDSTSPIRLAIVPNEDGSMQCKLMNRIGLEQSGVLEVGDKPVSYQMPPNGEASIRLDGITRPTPGQIHRWADKVHLVPANGPREELPIDLECIFISRGDRITDWSGIPAIPLRPQSKRVAGSNAENIRLVWAESGLALRVEGRTAGFAAIEANRHGREENRTRRIASEYQFELFLDTGANGREDGHRAMDHDDYCYAVAVNVPEAGDPVATVNRRRRVYHQLAGGVSMPTEQDVEQKIACTFESTGEGFVLTLQLGPEFLLPIGLKPGSVFGIGFVVTGAHLSQQSPSQTRDRGQVVYALQPEGSELNEPANWPLAVLKP